MDVPFPPVTRLFAESALLPEGWARNVLLEIDGGGAIVSAEAGGTDTGAERAAGPVIPGLPNLHSHAFQRAMAGLAERAAGPDDSFWTWREVMYGFVARLGPEEAEAIAAQLYLEMLEAGYTAVAEFHYLHHTPAGTPYADLAEMGRRHAAAARQVGIGITLLPVLYSQGGFGGENAGEGQKRFLNDPQRLLQIVQLLQEDVSGDPNAVVGMAPHSLRAITPEQLSEAVAGLNALDAEAPIHIHIAEQTREVKDCLRWSGTRPVRWLLNAQPVDQRWCLVHATHMDEAETRALAASGAIAGLCPTTEANLGDGFFHGVAYTAAGGAWGVGSDSHISVSPWEELRLLEYGQRLRHQRRNLLRPASGGSVGASLYQGALRGGAQACGRPLGALAAGKRADLLVLDPETPALWGREQDALLDAAIFAGNINPVRDVMVGGRWVVRDRCHPRRAEVAAACRKALNKLTAGL